MKKLLKKLGFCLILASLTTGNVGCVEKEQKETPSQTSSSKAELIFWRCFSPAITVTCAVLGFLLWNKTRNTTSHGPQDHSKDWSINYFNEFSIEMINSVDSHGKAQTSFNFHLNDCQDVDSNPVLLNQVNVAPPLSLESQRHLKFALCGLTRPIADFIEKGLFFRKLLKDQTSRQPIHPNFIDEKLIAEGLTKKWLISGTGVPYGDAIRAEIAVADPETGGFGKVHLGQWEYTMIEEVYTSAKFIQ